MPRTDRVVVTASAPEDLLALAAHTLGHWPQESLVLISLRGPRRRTGQVVRIDLAPFLELDERGLEHTAPQLVAHLAADGARSAVALLCTRSGGVRDAHRALVRALECALHERGLLLQDAGLVDGDLFYSLSCDDACCPPQGRPLGDVASTLVGTEMVLRGRVLAADRPSAVAALLAGVAPEAEPARAEVGALLDAGEGGAAWAAGPVREWLALVDATAALAGTTPAPHGAPAGTGAGAGDVRARGGPLAPLSADEAAAAVLTAPRAAGLLGALEDLLVRDLVVVSVVPGARGALTGSAFAPAPLAERVLDALVLVGRAQDAGDPAVIDAAGALVRRAARLAPPHLRAQPLAVLAHWGWWCGSTVEASALAQEALRADPGHSLAALVVQLADHAVAPEWVRAARADDLAAPPRGRRGR